MKLQQFFQIVANFTKKTPVLPDTFFLLRNKFSPQKCSSNRKKYQIDFYFENLQQI